MPYTFRKSNLPTLDLEIQRGSDLDVWIEAWEGYVFLSGLRDEDEQTKVYALKQCLTDNSRRILTNLGLTADQMSNMSTIIARIKSHAYGQVNETVERHKLRRRTQKQGETIDDYVVELRELVKTCNFCSDKCTEKAIRDQLVEGLHDPDAVEDLLKIDDFTLTAAVKMAVAVENAKKNLTDIARGAEVRAMKSSYKKNKLPQQSMCNNCGFANHKEKSKCPANGQQCRTCGKTTHFSKTCRSADQKQPSEGEKTPHTDNEHETKDRKDGKLGRLLVVNAMKTAAAPTIKVKITHKNKTFPCTVLPDSGADICAAGADFLGKIGMTPGQLNDSQMRPEAVNGQRMKPLGSIDVMIEFMGRHVQETIHIYRAITGALLSWKACQALGILPDTYPMPIGTIKAVTSEPKPTATPRKEAETNKKRSCPADDLMNEFKTVFDANLRTMPGEEFRIRLTDDAEPFSVSSPRTVPYPLMQPLKDEIDLLTDKNIIGPETDTTDWVSPISIALKKGGKGVRMCGDFTKLNKFVKRERYTISTPEMAVADIAKSKAKIFTTFDALKGYHQVPLDEISQKLTTFITPFGRYKFLQAPYGISSISEHYDRRMDSAFEGLTGFRRVVDDIVIFDENEEKHIEHVRQFLRRCEEKGILLNPDKFKFGQPEANFAGFMLTGEGYRVSDDIVDAIQKFPTPACRTDIRSFFGLINQLSGSTRDISEATATLKPLLSAKNEFIWDGNHERAFEHAKKILSRAPTLAYFDMNRETRLVTDASRVGLGFVLQQKHGNDWRMVKAGSRVLTDTESRYAIIELEMLGVAWATEKCRTFLLGLQHFTVITDHNPLTPILNSHRMDEIENPRLQRLRLRLAQYNFSARWLKGQSNSAADSLSRHPVNEPTTGDELAEIEPDGSQSDLSEPSPPIKAIKIAEIRDRYDDDNLRLQEVRDRAVNDDDYRHLLTLIKDGFPDTKNDMPDGMKKYWGVRQHLSVDDGLIVEKCTYIKLFRARCRHISSQNTLKTP